MNDDKEARIAAMKRRHSHLSPGARRVMDAASDWYGKCRICGRVITGTKAELEAHYHDHDTD